ncbi:hypothetical protein AVEN_200143-1 [Araneus ventricosus]|uniref:Uncharacterized protein n=1 Tax=Araneus ventricosus TaxID=182803 RepID=A0A4Y2W865_ARAVE|nr:hypothetical protein AVEN_200143-1 [Araneus ventricosus]
MEKSNIQPTLKKDSEGIKVPSSLLSFVVKQAEEYADYLIIKSALEIEKRSQCVVVVGEDIDFLVIIAASTNSENIFFLKPGRGEEEIYQSSEPQQVVNIFRDENACPDDIDEAGEKVLIALYGRKKSVETRDSLIFKLFQKSLVKNNFILVFLPPTTAAAREHSLRAYLQVQHWSGFAKRPLDWCWKETKHGLFSVTTHKEPASPALFSMISLQVRKRAYFDLHL